MRINKRTKRVVKFSNGATRIQVLWSILKKKRLVPMSCWILNNFDFLSMKAIVSISTS